MSDLGENKHISTMKSNAQWMLNDSLETIKRMKSFADKVDGRVGNTTELVKTAQAILEEINGNDAGDI